MLDKREREIAARSTAGLPFRCAGGSVSVVPTGNSPQPAFTQHIVGDLPRCAADGPSRTHRGSWRKSQIPYSRVDDAMDSEQKFNLNVSSKRMTGAAIYWQMTGRDIDSANHVGQAPQVEVKEISRGEAPKALPWRQSSWTSIALVPADRH